MGKLIAVWGSPDSGKTTFSVKLAEALYNRSRGKSAVIVVFTDIVTPSIPVIFPNWVLQCGLIYQAMILS